MSNFPDAQTLRSLFDYDPETGILAWRKKDPLTKQDKRFNSIFAGKRAGTLDSWGHRQIKINGRLHLAHRLIWALVTGAPPTSQIDHIDGDRDHNAWSNLREATPQQNAWNRAPSRHSGTGTLGVHFHKDGRSKPYRAMIHVDGKRRFLGYFTTLDEASAAYAEAFNAHRSGAWLRS